MQHLLSPPNILLAGLLSLAMILIRHRRHHIVSHLKWILHKYIVGIIILSWWVLILTLLWLIRDNWSTVRYWIFGICAVMLIIMVRFMKNCTYK